MLIIFLLLDKYNCTNFEITDLFIVHHSKLPFPQIAEILLAVSRLLFDELFDESKIKYNFSEEKKKKRNKSRQRFPWNITYPRLICINLQDLATWWITRSENSYNSWNIIAIFPERWRSYAEGCARGNYTSVIVNFPH